MSTLVLDLAVSQKCDLSTPNLCFGSTKTICKNLDKRGNKALHFDDIENLKSNILHHIKNREPEAGYDEYNEEFREEYLDCWGNSL